jgi:hypothetical protein
VRGTSWEARLRDFEWGSLPDWVRSNEVLRAFDACGIKVEVVFDEKYLSGRADRPLVVCRGKVRRRPWAMSLY